MQSGKSIKKTKKSSTEALSAPEVTNALDAPQATKRAVKTVTSAAVKEVAIVTPSSSVATRKTQLHRAAKPVTVPVEITPEKPMTKAAGAGETKAAAVPRTITHDDVAKLAYHYWVARGQQHGNPYEDWIRAEHELRSSR